MLTPKDGANLLFDQFFQKTSENEPGETSKISPCGSATVNAIRHKVIFEISNYEIYLVMFTFSAANLVRIICLQISPNH